MMFQEKQQMKAKNEHEELVKFGVRIPKKLKDLIVLCAINERRSANDEFIVLMEKALKEKEGGGK
jgi:hypothetical protein